METKGKDPQWVPTHHLVYSQRVFSRTKNERRAGDDYRVMTVMSKTRYNAFCFLTSRKNT